MKQWQRTMLDFGPLLLFFVAYQSVGIMAATLVLIVATVAALGITWVVERKIHQAPLISGVLVVAFGGLTLLLQDETFLKLKPTIINLFFAGVLLWGAYVKRRGFLKPLMDMAITMPDEAWRVLSARWGWFFLLLAVINELVWRTQTTEFWVSFKVFGFMPLTFVFLLSQMPFIQRHYKEE